MNGFNNENNKNENLIKFINKFNITESINDREKFTTLLAEFNNNNIRIFFNIEPTKNRNIKFPYMYIPRITTAFYNNYYIGNVVLSLAKIELSKDGDNENLEKEYKLSNIYKEYVQKVLQNVYGLNNKREIETKVESIIEVYKIIGLIVKR